MYIIAGLGNPGTRYAGTRHNIGFDAVTHLSDRYGIRLSRTEQKALCGSGQIEGQKVLLVQPQTFMNLSGMSIRALADYYKIDPEEELIVIYDDVSLEPGKLRVRAKGSAGGHNGMKDIIAHLETQEFPRIRVGVGAKIEGQDLVNHVLGHFSGEDRELVQEAVRSASDAVRLMVQGEIDAAMNQYNKKVVKE